MMLLRTLLAVIRAAIYGWLLALIRLIRAWLSRKKDTRDERDKRAARSHCVPIDRPEYLRPDPLIYSQRYLMDQGLAVTWDNPDIVLYENGVPVASHELKAATTYEVRSRIWNDSLDCPVIAMKVHLSYLDFGIGTTPIPVGSASGVFVGVKGTANNPAFVSIPWRTPAAPGHYCLQVALDPVEDRLPANNLGQENTDVGAVHSPAEFRFRLRNDTRRRERYRFEVDAYAIPPPDPCRPRPKRPRPPRQAPGTVEHVPPQHDRRNAPLPAGWTVTFDPEHPVLAAGDEVDVTATVTAPAGFHGRQPVNVHAFTGEGLAGGVTLYVESA